jgi:hypothetical protein
VSLRAFSWRTLFSDCREEGAQVPCLRAQPATCRAHLRRLNRDCCPSLLQCTSPNMARIDRSLHCDDCVRNLRNFRRAQRSPPSANFDPNRTLLPVQKLICVRRVPGAACLCQRSSFRRAQYRSLTTINKRGASRGLICNRALSIPN